MVYLQYCQEITWHCVYPRPARVLPASCVHCARVSPASDPRSARTMPAFCVHAAHGQPASCVQRNCVLLDAVFVAYSGNRRTSWKSDLRLPNKYLYSFIRQYFFRILRYNLCKAPVTIWRIFHFKLNLLVITR